jgi:hypothetical protein
MGGDILFDCDLASGEDPGHADEHPPLARVL